MNFNVKRRSGAGRDDMRAVKLYYGRAAYAITLTKPIILSRPAGHSEAPIIVTTTHSNNITKEQNVVKINIVS